MTLTTTRRFLFLAVVAVAVPACSGDEAIEDGIDDAFTVGDGKTDAFGVEDWSPDGAAVLKYCNQASKAELEDEAGLSARVAGNIVKGRDGQRYTDLAQLDKVPYVGKTVFKRLLRTVTEKKLYRTSIRVPILTSAQNGRHQYLPAATLNPEMRAAWLREFGTYLYVDERTDYTDKMDGYTARIEELNGKTHSDHTSDMLAYVTVNAYDVNSYNLSTCYIGDPAEVPDLVQGKADDLVSDQYVMSAYRYGSKKTFVAEDEADYEGDYDRAWRDFDTSSKSVLLIYSTSDDGDEREADLIPPCRK